MQILESKNARKVHFLENGHEKAGEGDGRRCECNGAVDEIHL